MQHDWSRTAGPDGGLLECHSWCSKGCLGTGDVTGVDEGCVACVLGMRAWRSGCFAGRLLDCFGWPLGPRPDVGAGAVRPL